jgi:hypothetical protein
MEINAEIKQNQIHDPGFHPISQQCLVRIADVFANAPGNCPGLRIVSHYFLEVQF